MSFRLSSAAANDILAIAEQGIQLFGIMQARRYNDDLFRLFEVIAANPRMARERHELSPPMRIHPFKAHLVVYAVDEGGDVFIVRVRHGHEEWAADTA